MAATVVAATATELPTQTVVPLAETTSTAASLPTVTTAPTVTPTEVPLPPLALIADLINAGGSMQELEALMTNEFALQPLPYAPQIKPPQQAVPDLRTYLSMSPQVVVTEDIPEAIGVAEWGGETADFIAYTTGWGLNSKAVGLMLFTQIEADVLWSGLILSTNNFSPTPELVTVPPPLNLTYQFENHIFVVTDSGPTSIFQMDSDAETDNLINPTNSRLLEVLFDADSPERAQQVTVVDLTTGSRQPIDLPYIVARFGMGWLNEHIIGMGVWFDDEDMIGQTPGRPALFDVVTGEWTLLAEHHAIISEVGNARLVYTSPDELVVWRETGTTNLLFTEGGLPVLSHSEQRWIVVTSNKIAIGDSEGRTELMEYFRSFGPGATFLTQVAWNPDDAWVALRPATNELEFDGVWLYPVGGGEMVRLGNGTSNPLWQDSETVLFNAVVNGMMQLHAYNVLTAERTKIDVPDGSIPIHFALPVP